MFENGAFTFPATNATPLNFYRYHYDAYATNAGIDTMNIACCRVGQMVTISGNITLTSAKLGLVTTEAIPSDFRPIIRTRFHGDYADGSQKYRIYGHLKTSGLFYMEYVDTSTGASLLCQHHLTLTFLTCLLLLLYKICIFIYPIIISC